MNKKIFLAILTGLIVLLYSSVNVFAVSQGEILTYGNKNKWVTELQQALHDKGYLKVSPTGYFGTDTQAAVLGFQKDKGLKQDGLAGPATRKALLGNKYKAITATKSDSKAAAPADINMISPGAQGPEVKELQTHLKTLGYYTYSKITGYYGPVTKDAVQKFQSDNDLKTDGIAGSKTLSKLYEEKTSSVILCKGDKGSDVEAIQSKLKKLKYFSGSVTGYFGTQTLGAVQLFQKANKLTVDGKVGPKTSEVLFSNDAKKYAAPEKTAQESTGKDSNKEDSDTKKDDTDTKKEDTDKEDTGSGDDTQKATSKLDKFIAIAKDQQGKPYSWGQCGPASFDCSGFVYYSLKNAGVNIARLSSRSYSVYSGWTKIESLGDIQKGDLLFFKSDSSSTVSHVAIALDKNTIIHASSGSKKVLISSIKTTGGYYTRNFVVARRVFK